MLRRTFEALEPRVLFAVDALDLAFSGDGVATASFSDLGDLTQVYGRAVAVAPDGRVVVAGVGANNTNSLNWATLAAFNGTTGVADSSFGNAGRVIYTPGSSYLPEFNAVAVQSDGKILAAGRNDFFAVNGDMLFARYDINGVPDTTFGLPGTGFVAVGVAGESDFANSLHIVTGGAVLALGEISRDFGLARLTSTGAPDSGFNGTGLRRTDWYGGRDTINDGAIQTDGKIVAVGQAFSAPTAGHMHPVLARYSSTGTLDPAFGIGGKLDADSILGHGSIISVAMQADGKIVVAGRTLVGPRMYVARFSSTGVLDTSFSGDGVEYIGATNTVVDLSVAVESDGTILYGFSDYDQSFVRRSVVGKLTPYGARDLRFGSGGEMVIAVPASQATVTDIAILPSGKAMLTGDVAPSTTLRPQPAAMRLDTAPVGAAASLASGVLTITGTAGDDSVILENDFVSGIRVTINGSIIGSFASSSITSISADLLGGDDLLRMEQVLFEPVFYNGNSGRDALIFKASNGTDDDLIINAQYIIGGGNEASLSSVEDMTVDAMSSTDFPIIDVGAGFAGNLRVEGGNQDDTFDIRSAPLSAVRVTLSGGSGDDTFLFSSLLTQGAVVAEGGADNDAVQIDGTAGIDQISVSDASVTTGSAAASGLSGVERIQISAAAGNDTFTLNGLPAGVITTLDGGPGSDAFNITPGAGLTQFNNSTLNVIGGADTDEVLFSGQSQSTSFALTLTETRFSWAAKGLLLDFDATMEAVRLTGGIGNDSFTVTPSLATAFSVNGSSPARIIPGDVLNLVPGGATGLSIGNSVLNFSNRKSVSYQSIESFQNVSTGPFVMDCGVDVNLLQLVSFNFSTQMSSNLLTTSITAQNLSTGESFVGSPNGLGGTGRQTFMTWYFSTVGILPDGNYRVTLPAGSITSSTGQPMAADFVYDFYILAADANRDRKVDIQDLYALSSNWLGTGKRFFQGDFNYDAKVDAADLALLAARWQQNLPAPAAPALAPAPALAVPRRTPVRVANSVLT